MEIHEDPAEDPEATPFQRIGEDRVHLGANLAAGPSHFDIDLGYERNRRREFEEADATDVALGLLAKTYSGDVRFHHVPLGPFAGIVGVSGLRNEFEKFGEETLIPNNPTTTSACMPSSRRSSGRWNLSLGARYDYRRLSVEDDEELGVMAQERTLQLGHRKRRCALSGGGAGRPRAQRRSGLSRPDGLRSLLQRGTRGNGPLRAR